jgi:hypothetical protein
VTFYGDAGLGRNPKVGAPVRLRQNGVAGRIVEERITPSGNAWRVRCEDGYEAWFPAEGLLPNEDVS